MELNTGFPGAIDAIALGSNHMCQSTDGFGVYRTLETHGCYKIFFFQHVYAVHLRKDMPHGTPSHGGLEDS